MTYEIDLSGRRALVTGAGQGVGQEIASTLAEAGAEVFVNDLVPERANDVAAAITANGGRATGAAFDVTDYGAVHAPRSPTPDRSTSSSTTRGTRAGPRRWAWRTSPRWCRPSRRTGSPSSR